MTLAELHEKEKHERLQAKEAKLRHLKRAFAGIDKTQMTAENRVFQTVSRDVACKVYEDRPEGTDGGIYAPQKIKF